MFTFDGIMPGSTTDVMIMKIKTNACKMIAIIKAEKSSQYSQRYYELLRLIYLHITEKQ